MFLVKNQTLGFISNVLSFIFNPLNAMMYIIPILKIVFVTIAFLIIYNQSFSQRRKMNFFNLVKDSFILWLSYLLISNILKLIPLSPHLFQMCISIAYMSSNSRNLDILSIIVFYSPDNNLRALLALMYKCGYIEP